MKQRWIVVVCLVTLIGGAAGGFEGALPGAVAPAAAQGDVVGSVLALVNQFRAANGLPALELHPALMAAAQGHASWIVQTGQFGHTGAGGSTPQDRAVAAGYTGVAFENYVYGGGIDPNWAVNWWRNSGVHRAVMLSEAQHAGVGFAQANGDNLYVLVVGRYRPPEPTPDPDRVAAADSGSGAGDSSGSSADEAAAEDEDPGPVVVPILIAEPREDGSVWHVVQQGQTAWAIAARYRVDLDEMLALNGLQRPVVLKPGDEVLVKLAPGQAPPPTPTPITSVRVQDGQTVWEIAVTHGLTVDELLAINGLTRADVILPGDELRLRPPEDNAPSPEDDIGDDEPAAAYGSLIDAEPPDSVPTSAPPTEPPAEAAADLSPTGLPTPLPGGPPTLPPPPGEQPSATPTPAPTQTRRPTMTPWPTNTPLPTVTDLPTATSLASDTPPPEPSATPLAVAQAAPGDDAPSAPDVADDAEATPARVAVAPSDEGGTSNALLIGLVAMGLVWFTIGAGGLVLLRLRRTG